mmetsp:Transcript_1138/g.2601  ORF Transcript_1138/g.2601 Transcript_1138/m.2601 type:complete len:224 (-) Transcript_1138:220-891(-)
MERGDWLLRGSDEVLVQLGMILVFNDLVQDIVIVCQLCRFGHQILLHEEGRLQGSVAALREEGQTIVDQRLVQQHTGARQEVAPVAGDLKPGVELDGADHLEQLEVRPEAVCLVGLALEAARNSPGSNHLVVLVLILGDGNSVVDQISNGTKELVPLGLGLFHDLLEICCLPLKGRLLLQQVLTLILALGGLLLLGDLALHLVHLFALLIQLELLLDPQTIQL